MKKTLGLLLALLIALTVTACGQDTGKTFNENEIKDVTMLLSGIGGELATVKSLGNLPEPQINGQLFFYNTKEIDGYFNGFNLGIELAGDQKTVTQIYIEPYGENQIKVNGFIIGCDISETNALFGKGELGSAEQNGTIFTYMTYQDNNYTIKCTVDNNQVTAVSFTPLILENAQVDEEETAEGTETDNQNEDSQNNEEVKPIELSMLMTKDDIIKALGDDYTFETVDGYEFYLTYDGIEFLFLNDGPINEELSSDSTIVSARITSNQYTFNYDINIGDSAREVLEYCSNKFGRTYNIHGDNYLIGMFNYSEEGVEVPISLTFGYSDEQFNFLSFTSIEDVPEDLTIQVIEIVNISLIDC